MRRPQGEVERLYFCELPRATTCRVLEAKRSKAFTATLKANEIDGRDLGMGGRSEG